MIKALWNDLLEVIWPKKWLRLVELETGMMVILSQHRTSGDALLAIRNPVVERVIHVDDLAPGAFLLGIEL